MSKRILILGAGFMQGVAIRAAKARGWYVVAVDGNPSAPCRDIADRFEPIDLKDVRALVNLAIKLKESTGLDGVMTAATDFSVSVAAIAKACGLPGHSLEAAKNASDKILMRERFAEAGIPSPAFVGLGAMDIPVARGILSARRIDFPLVVKPCDNMGARGCRRVDSPKALDMALTDAVRYSRTGRVIVEEYMDGPEFSFEALVYDGQFRMTGMADRHIRFPPYFIEMGHTIPSRFPPSDLAALERVFRDATRALDLTHGVAKGDLKLTAKGPMVGEIAGRMSGGYMSGWTYPYSSGIDLTGAALDLAVGIRPVALEPSLRSVCAERAWISIPGIVSELVGLEVAQSLPGVRDVFPRSLAGDSVAFPRNNVEKCGNAIAVADDYDSAARLAEAACQSVFLRLLPRNAETDSFLSQFSDDSFPPSAFDCDISTLGSSWSTETHEIGGRPIEIPKPLIACIDTSVDWQGRTLREAIEAALAYEPGLRDALSASDARAASLWRALIRGGIQGIVYVYDSHRP